MYGLVGRMIAEDGKRDELAGIMASIGDMPGCLSYVVALDASDQQSIWVTEVWESAEAHAASLALPAVQQAIERGSSLIAGFAQRSETDPIGGIGLP